MPTRLPRPACAGRDLALAAGHPLAVQAGLRVGAEGGNAVDAAVAAAFALTVVLPAACGLGGDALLIVRTADGDLVAFNGVGRAPAGLAGPLPPDGAGTAAVPGLVAGLADAHAHCGRLPFDRVVAPAVDLAARGVPVSANTADGLVASRARLERGGAAASPWFADGEPVLRGRPVVQPALADALAAIAEHGAPVFYSRALAEAVAGAVQRDGGAMTVADLAAHETVIREPVSVAYRDAAVHVQPPSSQAILLAMALAALDREPAAPGAVGAHRAVEAIVAAFARRDEVTSTPEDELLQSAAELELPERASGRVVARAYNHTTAVTAAEPGGLAVSMLISVFDPFGCGTYVPEGGFFLNDRMLGFSRDPDSPNAPAPGKRPVHTLSPALFERDGRAVAIATPGADGQVQVLLQLLQALVDEDEDPAVALERGRWRAVAGRLQLEDDLVGTLGPELAALGHAVDVTSTGDGLFGSVCIAQADPEAGVATAWADARRESWAGAW